jgi:hypothetical protein
MASSDASAERRRYATLIADPEAWILKARDIARAASLLEPGIRSWWKAIHARAVEKRKVVMPPDLQSVYFLLMAFAMENAVKGMLAVGSKKLRRDVEQTGKLPKIFDNHDLVKLSTEIGFPVSTTNEDLLRRLSRHSVWAGRYPAPRHVNDASFSAIFNDGRRYHVSYFARSDVQHTKRLLAEIAHFFFTEFRSTNLRMWLRELKDRAPVV